jgi:hypothetical protein
MATNHTDTGDAWVATLLQPAPRLLWCDECHCFHGHSSECPYSPKAGA